MLHILMHIRSLCAASVAKIARRVAKIARRVAKIARRVAKIARRVAKMPRQIAEMPPHPRIAGLMRHIPGAGLGVRTGRDRPR